MRMLAFLAVAACGRVGFDAEPPDAGAEPVIGPDAATATCTPGPWQPPHLLTRVDTLFDEVAPALSGDKLTLAFETDRAGTPDIYISTRASVADDFGPGLAVSAVNTYSSERDPTLSSDGLVMYFTSDRTSTPLMYASRRSSTTAAFGTPELVAELSQTTLMGPALSPHGDELFYSDFVDSVVERAAYAAGTGFVPIGSVSGLPTGSVAAPSLAGDDHTLYFAHRPSSLAPYQIFAAERSAPGAAFGPSTEITDLSALDFDTTDPEISKDGRTIVFASTRPGGIGAFDLYLSERTCL